MPSGAVRRRSKISTWTLPDPKRSLMAARTQPEFGRSGQRSIRPRPRPRPHSLLAAILVRVTDLLRPFERLAPVHEDPERELMAVRDLVYRAGVTDDAADRGVTLLVGKLPMRSNLVLDAPAGVGFEVPNRLDDRVRRGRLRIPVPQSTGRTILRDAKYRRRDAWERRRTTVLVATMDALPASGDSQGQCRRQCRWSRPPGGGAYIRLRKVTHQLLCRRSCSRR